MRGLPTTKDKKKSGTASSNYFDSILQSRIVGTLSGRRQAAPGAGPSLNSAQGTHTGPEEKKQVRSTIAYVPQHAAATFTKTTTTRKMRRDNEIL